MWSCFGFSFLFENLQRKGVENVVLNNAGLEKKDLIHLELSLSVGMRRLERPTPTSRT